jgi:hypothetical protein
LQNYKISLRVKAKGLKIYEKITKEENKKNPAAAEATTGTTPVGVDGFEPPTLCL